MRRERIILGAKHLLVMRRTMLVVGGLAVASIAVSGIRLMQSKLKLADLTETVKVQKNTLVSLRQTATKPVAGQESRAKLDADAVARVQAVVEKSIRSRNCAIDEFQASTDRAPYLSLFTLDTNHPEWEQVPIHLTLKGTLKDVTAAMDDLRNSGIPMEPDTIELIADNVDHKTGKTRVALRLIFRVLVRQNGGTA